MTLRFQHHYTREEARRLLPLIESWLKKLELARTLLRRALAPIESFHAGGCDVGGGVVERYLNAFLDLRAVLREFSSREIFVKDLDSGLIDFPSFAEGREVFLCWRRGESDIQHWHELDAGYAGRESLDC